MSAAAAILALTALAAAGSLRRASAPVRRPSPAGSRSRSGPPERFRSPENALAGTTYYHGSESAFIRFDPLKRRTSYGIFFSPDPDTAGFYGNNLYSVLLFAKNPADFDDPMVLQEVAKETLWNDNFEVLRKDQYGGFESADSRDIARHVAPLLDAAAKASPQAARIISDWMDTQEVDPEGKVDEYREELLEELLRDEDFWTDHPLWAALPESERKAFSASFVRVHPEVRAIEESYGTDAFYLNHQDEMLQAAEKLGYDAVIMTDPSSVGESSSVVVFSGDQVFIVDRQDVTPTRRR